MQSSEHRSSKSIWWFSKKVSNRKSPESPTTNEKINLKQKIFYDRLTNYAVYIAIQWMSFPSMQLK